MARAALNWTVRDLAEATKLHRNTITNIETGRYAGDTSTLGAIETVLKRAGIEYIDENGGGPGVRLRKNSTGEDLTRFQAIGRPTRAIHARSEERCKIAMGGNSLVCDGVTH